MELEWTVPEECGELMLRSFIRGRAGLSASLWKRIKWNGRVTVNGEDVHNARMTVRGGDRIRCEWEEETDIVAADIPLSVVYEDEDLLVVDKGPGMIIHPTHRDICDSLVNACAGYFASRGEKAGIHPVYRLDRNTTGLVIVAKSAKVQYDLSRSHDQITRRYIALASGHLEEERGTADAPIGRKPGSIVEWTVRDDGRRAVTSWEVLGRGEGAHGPSRPSAPGRRPLRRAVRAHRQAGAPRGGSGVPPSPHGRDHAPHRAAPRGHAAPRGESGRFYKG